MQIPQYTQAIDLRPYQEEIIQKARQSLKQGHKRVILQAPTGTGKTRTAAAIIQSALNKNRSVMFACERRDLVYQTSDVFKEFGMPNDIIMSGEDTGWFSPLKVVSKDTLYHRGIKTNKMLMPPADLIIVDEVHLSLSDTWLKIFEYYRDSTIVGLTATPAGKDGRGLGEFYEDMALSPPISQFIEEGYLVPPRYFRPVDPDLSGIGTDYTRGDYRMGGRDGAAKRFDTPEVVGDVFNNWSRIAGHCQTVVFACNRKHAQHLFHTFRKNGISTGYIDCDTPTDERKRVIEGVKSGEIQVLCNVSVVSYGIDLPSLECAVLARPYKNLRDYLQAVGRVLRISPETGKTEAKIIDHCGAIRDCGYIEDDIEWSLKGRETVQERREIKRKAKEKAEEHEPREIICCKCQASFKGRRDCPNCGFVAIPMGEPIPVIEADLQEVKSTDESLQKKRNREVSYEAKAWFYGQLKQYEKERGYKPGWAARQYKARYNVWPNDKRVKEAPERPVTKNVANYIKHQLIKYAKSRRAAA